MHIRWFQVYGTKKIFAFLRPEPEPPDRIHPVPDVEISMVAVLFLEIIIDLCFQFPILARRYLRVRVIRPNLRPDLLWLWYGDTPEWLEARKKSVLF